MLDDGTFLFYTDNYAGRYIVQTTNNGQLLASGLIKKLDDNWMKPLTWQKVDYFGITNFNGVAGISLIHILL